MNSSLFPTNYRPKAKHKGLLTQELKGETLIYNTNNNRAVCLNSIASDVWSLCDGQKNIASIVASLKKEKGIESNEDLISLTLFELNSNDLLVETDQIAAFTNGFNRRDAIRKIGIATAFALPVISSLVAPAAASAASGSSGGYCSSSCVVLGSTCACLPVIVSGACPSGLSLNLSLGLGVCVSAGAGVGDVVLATATAGVQVCLVANACITIP